MALDTVVGAICVQNYAVTQTLPLLCRRSHRRRGTGTALQGFQRKQRFASCASVEERLSDDLARLGHQQRLDARHLDDSRTALASRLYYLLALYGYDMKRAKCWMAEPAFNELSTKPVKRKAGNVTLKEAESRQKVVRRVDFGLRECRFARQPERSFARCASARDVHREGHQTRDTGWPHPGRCEHPSVSTVRTAKIRSGFPKKGSPTCTGPSPRTAQCTSTATTAAHVPGLDATDEPGLSRCSSLQRGGRIGGNELALPTEMGRTAV